MDRLECMQVFVRVAENGSFSAVARQMAVARSVVTRQVAALEAHLGAKLLARSTRSLSLTSAGIAYLERCREILNLVDAAETGLAGEGAEPRGTIRLSVPLSFGLRHLAPLLLDFAVTFPEISVEVDFTDRRVKLVEEGLDLAIRITLRLDPLDVARRIGSSRLVVVASPEYLRRHGEPTHPQELADRECLIYLPAQQGGWPFLVDGTLRTYPVSGRIRANNGDALLDATIRGLGISAQPSFLVAPALEAGWVRPILTDYPLPELGIYALLPGNRYVPRRVRVLIDTLAERIGSRPYWEQGGHWPPAPPG
ncbi:MAG TPA: LysR family transcriptional regulator [Rhodocyclaceae bacterium]|nr:LysR family transcriptional regulator [Rhodocyclaceae bacterium]HMW77008.1 LysR family transcriptional regulator [Rhodocyclaceae bacterium]HNE42136.1 LysR family transcriptional regulator [Rhodocyclaceae bacterium]HNL20550.1 LysR family transcriptional regulator [Rhodocyclaceae bacterium]HNM22968.1 LysR family transcriptional regulator [Rhodocyclaceae bacterium]